MTARTARRKRIIRVRTVEHQMAEANLARANGELASLVELSRRLEALRADLAVARGVVAGRALNTVGELGVRLDMAKENLATPLVNASARRNIVSASSRLPACSRQVPALLIASAMGSFTSSSKQACSSV